MSAPNRFSQPSLNLEILSPLTRWVTITPHDTDFLPFLPRIVSCEEGGTIVCEDAKGTQTPWLFDANQDRAMRPQRILATGTTAALTIIIAD